jgi:lipid II:glycine glycyltransferase (peptidoglycan interpeptide bridge formation enzyme)
MTALTLKILDTSDEKDWDEVVRLSSHGTIFHTIAWLRIAAEQSRAELVPCMFYKGTQLVGIYPIFIQEHGLTRIALSPPSRSYMLYLGPIIADYESLKQDKKETIYIEMQKEMDNFIFNTRGCKFARIRSSPGILDSRPLKWSGYNIDPYYTYRIDLSGGLDRVWEHFDRKLRVEINKASRDGVTVRTGDWEDLVDIHDSLFIRYQQQGLKPINYLKYLQSLYSMFQEENMKIFVAEYQGRRIGGTINLCFKNIMYLWVGIPKSDLPGISPNALIQWEAIRWAQAHGITIYEEMDAGDDPRLRYFKSKFNPDLVIWYSGSKYSSVLYKAGEKLFNIFKK